MKSVRRRGNERGTTLEQVAEKAGVHPMTVSRAMQGSQKVAPATRERIEHIAKELNYLPNTAARALAMGRTNTIAVVTGPVNEHFYGNLLNLIEIELGKDDYKLAFFRSHDLNRDLMAAVSANAVDGIIAIDALPFIQELVQTRPELLPPHVFAGVGVRHWKVAASSDIVEVDLEPGVNEALQAMLASGCRRVALIGPMGLNAFYESRLTTYLKAMFFAQQAPEIIEVSVGTGSYDRDEARRGFIDYLKIHGCPDGLFCYNDEMAIAAFRALRDLGFRVPEDVQLVGCDGIPYMAYFDPPLSTVEQPAEEMCATAWRFLKRRIEDEDCPPQDATLEAHLVVRASLKAYRG